MKKRNLTSLKLKKTTVSTFKVQELKGGITARTLCQFTDCCLIDKH